MSKMNDLKAKLQEKSKHEAEAHEKIRQEIADWPRKLNSLYDEIECYLTPLKSEGIVSTRQEETKFESDYKIVTPTITISYKEKSIKSDPSLMVIGSKGRVDFSGPKRSKLTLIMKGDTEKWHILSADPRSSKRLSDSPFSEDDIATFLEKAFY